MFLVQDFNNGQRKKFFNCSDTEYLIYFFLHTAHCIRLFPSESKTDDEFYQII